MPRHIRYQPNVANSRSKRRLTRGRGLTLPGVIANAGPLRAVCGLTRWANSTATAIARSSGRQTHHAVH